jgi:hypothetical protein
MFEMLPMSSSESKIMNTAVPYETKERSNDRREISDPDDVI